MLGEFLHKTLSEIEKMTVVEFRLWMAYLKIRNEK